MLLWWCLLLANAVGNTVETTREDWQWLASNRDPAFERLMPFSRIAEPNVTYRSYQDHYYMVPERYFSVRGWPRALEAVVVSPVGPSIQQQLLEMHVADRDASFESILARVKLHRAVILDAQCPALRRRLRTLPKVDTRLSDWSAVVFHAPSHLIRIEARDATVEVLANDDHNPSAQWAVRMFTELRECASATERAAARAVEQGHGRVGDRRGTP